MISYKHVITDEKGNAGDVIEFFRGERKTFNLYVHRHNWLPYASGSGITKLELRIPKADGTLIVKSTEDGSLSKMYYSNAHCSFVLTCEDTEALKPNELIKALMVVESVSNGVLVLKEIIEFPALFQARNPSIQHT